MLQDRDANASGRTSQGSSMSAVSRAPSRAPPGVPKPDLAPSALPGVMSMLRTSTEMGNVAGVTGDMSGMGNMPRPPQRFGASSRLSTASSLSNHSSRASRHPRDYHPHASAARYGPMRDQNAPQYTPDTLSPTTFNIPASSPRTARHTRMRNGHRSRSLTNPMHASYALSSNRSLGSLRPVPEQRPRSPLHNQGRSQRPYHRSTSPGSSDYPDSYSSSYSRRYNSYSNQGPPYDPPQMDRGQGQPYHSGSRMGRHGQPYNQGQMRRRVPSDGSLGRHERTHGIPRHSGRSPSPAYYTGPGADVPPMPRLPQQYAATDQRRMLNPSLGGSTSSRTTNLRTDSDTPSSDMTSPPTPQEGVSIEMFISPNGSRVPVYTKPDHLRDMVPRGPQYYDYSEPFENEQYRGAENDQVQTGIENQIKAIMGQQAPLAVSALQSGHSLGSQRSVRPVHPQAASMVEVPSSPVHQRITREMILKATESTPTSGTVKTLVTAPATNNDLTPPPNGLVAAHYPAKEHIFQSSSPSSSRPAECLEGRLSNPYQAGSSVPESSTLDFAVHGSIPIASGAGHGTEPSSQADSDSELPVSPLRSTKDGFSDMLAGYQQTQSRHGTGAMQEAYATPKKAQVLYEQVDKRSNHPQKSSEVLSFKSATDVLSDQEPSVKDSDARSFTTCEDSGSPGRAASMPPPKLLSTSLASLDRLQQRPASEMSLAVPPRVLRKPLPHLSQEISVVHSEDLATSNPIMQQSASSVVSMSQQPPPVPPRGSSSSKEAQNSHSVSSFLMRQWPARLIREKKLSKEDGMPGLASKEISARELMEHAVAPKNSVSSSLLPVVDVIQAPEKVLRKQEVLPERQVATPLIPKDGSPSKDRGVEAAPSLHSHVFGSLSPDLPRPSSVYSPEDSPVRSRVQSSQPGMPTCSERSRPDSQTTTHLDWHGKSFSSPLVCADVSSIRLSNSREGSTTDLRLSDYRYGGAFADQVGHLPQLREESHEDSSLNTSASNLMHSRFRLPHTAQGGVRASVDNAVVVSRSSAGSHQHGPRGGAQAQPCGLPSMDFSEMNLVHKMNEALGLPKGESNKEPSTKPLRLESVESNAQPRVSPRELREEYNSILAELDGFRKSGESALPTTATNLAIPEHLRSPSKYKAEIDGVRVPSVNAMSERLTTLLSSMRQYSQLNKKSEFIEEEVMLEQALGDIHNVGVGSLVTKRSFARLRPVPGSPTMIVVEDAIYEDLINREKENGTPRHHGDEAAKLSSGESGPDVKGECKSATHTTTHQNSSSSGLGRPSPAVLRPRALTAGHPDLRAAPEKILSSAQSMKSIVSEPTVTNPYPWRSDKNFPWDDSAIPSIDIALPSSNTVKHSPRPGPSHLRNTLSDASFESSFSSANTATGSRFGTASDSNAHARHHRFSNFGRTGDQPHAVGERYPTSALMPPTAIFRDHSSAFDSSDDEDFNSTRRPKLGLIKRFSSARNGTVDNKTRGAQGKTNRANLAASECAKHPNDSLVEDRSGEAQTFNSRRLTFRNATGMRPGEYRRTKIFGKLKKLWERGTDLIRTLSGRKQSDSATA